jgi:phosphoadenosine phosphosulfate reductase
MVIGDRETIVGKVRHFQASGKKIFATSSFQTQSIPLLHIISSIRPKIPIYFMNTGYLFPETFRYRDSICELFDLELRELVSEIPRNMQKGECGRLLFAFDPDYCCHVNKVRPLEPVLREFDIWINGVRADQSSTRRQFSEEEPTDFDVVRYHPLLSWTKEMVEEYISEYDFPRHPLELQGYRSIGCEPCTRRIASTDREARWFGMKKTECGLHTAWGKKR